MNKPTPTNTPPNHNLSFSVKNLGSVADGKFTLKPLTIFCGPNNSGKTWGMYALYSFFKNLPPISYFIEKEKQNNLYRKKHGNATEPISPFFNNVFLELLRNDFNLQEKHLSDVKFDCAVPISKWPVYLKNFLQSDCFIFLIPAERNGLNLFYRELRNRRTALLHHASKDRIDISELLHDVIKSRYAKPIADYIDWLNQLAELYPTNNEFHIEAMSIQKQLVKGRYYFNRTTEEISFRPYVKKGDAPIDKIGLHATSSTVKSLFGLWFYLEHQAKVGDIIMIDEPELNLHPHNQLVLTHLLARIVNMGIYVVMSTHSDYIVREVNNLILLNEDTRLLKTVNAVNKKQLVYKEDACLSDNKVGMYFFDNSTIKPFEYTKKQGFAVNTFDEVIVRQNDTNLELYHGLMEEAEDA